LRESALLDFCPERLEVGVGQCGSLDFFGAGQSDGPFQPTPGLIESPELAGVASQIIADDILVREPFDGRQEDSIGLGSALEFMESVGQVDAAEGDLRELTAQGLSGFRGERPFFGAGVELIAHAHDLGVCAQGPGDTRQFVPGLGRIGQPKPAFGGGEMMAVWRRQRFHGGPRLMQGS